MSIFIDCGTNLKQGIGEIRPLHSDITKIYTFEANTQTYDSLDKTDDIVYFNHAVSDKSGFTEFYIEKDHYSPDKNYFGLSSRIQTPEIRDSYLFDNGNTIIVNGVKYTNIEDYVSDTYKKIIVSKIRLVEFIEYLNVGDNEIILKLDVEGEEYAILEDMKNSGTFKKIKKLYVEFHERTRMPHHDDVNTWLEYFQNNNVDFTHWK